MLLACTLLFGLSVPASAYTYDYFFKSPQADRGFGSGSSTNSDSAIAFRDAENDNSKALFQLLLPNLSMSKNWKYTTDQSSDASVSVGEYITYVLHGLKGTFQNSGTLVSMTPDNGSGVGYVYDASKDYFASTWVGSRPTVTATDANRWRIQTLSDNHSGSWMYQVAHSVAQSGLTMEALMNWSNPDGGTLYMPSTSAPYSWFNQMLEAANNSKADTSKLATETTLASVNSRLYTLNALGAKDETLSALSNKVATESTLSSVNSTLTRSLGSSTSSFPYLPGYSISNNPLYTNSSNIRSTTSDTSVFRALNNNLLSLFGLFSPYKSGSATLGSSYSLFTYSLDSSFSKNSLTKSGLSFPQAVVYALNYTNTGLSAINGNLLKLDEILSTENDRALKDATDDTKTNVTDYVSNKKSNYGDSFTIGNTISDGLKPDLSTSDASSAIGGLFSSDSSDYWGWFSSATDDDLHPDASGVSTLSLDDEPSAQDVADAETVWVIDPSTTSSDLIADFFGGE